jgi:hypothetical protein
MSKGNVAVKGRPPYSRRISSEEAREGYILVLKNKLPFFPHLEEGFDLIHADVRGRVRVESYRCTCRGPNLPHEHYFIPWKGLNAGDRVEIRRDPEKQDRYIIQIRR